MQHIGKANSTNFKNRDLYAGEANDEQKKKGTGRLTQRKIKTEGSEKIREQ